MMLNNMMKLQNILVSLVVYSHFDSEFPDCLLFMLLCLAEQYKIVTNICTFATSSKCGYHLASNKTCLKKHFSPF